jgi:hypothetical protein
VIVIALAAIAGAFMLSQALGRPASVAGHHYRHLAARAVSRGRAAACLHVRTSGQTGQAGLRDR